MLMYAIVTVDVYHETGDQNRTRSYVIESSTVVWILFLEIRATQHVQGDFMGCRGIRE